MQPWFHSLQCLAYSPARRSMSSSAASLLLLHSVAEVRAWRKAVAARQERVGLVATMGALHDGHLELVRHSLRECERTIVSIFVNPAQFAPHEDLSTYPRPLESDLAKLRGIKDSLREVSAVFLPPVEAMYPNGIQQDVQNQTGTFIEVKGYSHQMEGGSRPTFFRGVATVVNKLFNIVQPDRTYFGQKDVQQCVVLRQMIRDLHLPFPPSAADMVVVPTIREPETGLAMSSRNLYLTPEDRHFAPLLYKALRAAESAYHAQARAASVDATGLLAAAKRVVDEGSLTAPEGRVRLDYVALNDPHTLRPLDRIEPGRGALLSGAMWVGQTRLIDNVLLDFAF